MRDDDAVWRHANRKEVQTIFDRYIQNNVRRLKRPEAIQMMMAEFSFSEDQASAMFDSFDKDKNNIMSIWEFQQFYMCVGKRYIEVVERFNVLLIFC